MALTIHGIPWWGAAQQVDPGSKTYSAPSLAQTGTGTLHGQVSDPSGAAIPGATVTVTTASGPANTSTNEEGAYTVKGLAPGQHSVQAMATEETETPWRVATVFSESRNARLRLSLGS